MQRFAHLMVSDTSQRPLSFFVICIAFFLKTCLNYFKISVFNLRNILFCLMNSATENLNYILIVFIESLALRFLIDSVLYSFELKILNLYCVLHIVLKYIYIVESFNRFLNKHYFIQSTHFHLFL